MSLRTQWYIVGAFGMQMAGVLVVGLRSAAPGSGLGLPAPDFSAELLRTGDTVSLSRYHGEVVLINIWATWCAPCEAEMPSIQRLYDELGPQGLRVLAVSVDETGRETVKQWVAARHLTFDVLHDRSRRIEEIYRTVGVPESFVVDRQGRMVKRVTGFIAPWDEPSQKALFRALLKQDRG